LANLSNNFTLEALTFSEIAERRTLDNTPNDEQIQNLTELAQALERVQSLLGHPLHISSAFRSPKVNSLVGGSPTSAHMEGYAADFTCEAFGTPLEVCKAISESDIPFDQVIYEYKSWCHFSCDPRMRKETLTKVAGEPYKIGFA
jgi:putative chitinase